MNGDHSSCFGSVFPSLSIPFPLPLFIATAGTVISVNAHVSSIADSDSDCNSYLGF
ncbi:hypothetical protein RSAG8_07829, partial [Rhizoctonia solani AG-8 WAC10335]